MSFYGLEENCVLVSPNKDVTPGDQPVSVLAHDLYYNMPKRAVPVWIPPASVPGLVSIILLSVLTNQACLVLFVFHAS